MTATATDWRRDWRQLVDPDAPPNTLALRDGDGNALCVACGCRADGHCKYKGECLTGLGTPDECGCANLTLEVPECPACLHLFDKRWQLQVHMLPTPTCQSSAWAAAGKYAQPPKFVPPLKARQAGKGR